MARVVYTDENYQTTYVDVNAQQPEITIGRQQGNMLRISSKAISRNHAKIVFQNGHYFFVDNNSSNGCFVNNARVNQSQEIRPGDKLRCGSVAIEFVDEPRGGAMPGAPSIAPMPPMAQPPAMAPRPAGQPAGPGFGAAPGFGGGIKPMGAPMPPMNNGGMPGAPMPPLGGGMPGAPVPPPGGPKVQMNAPKLNMPFNPGVSAGPSSSGDMRNINVRPISGGGNYRPTMLNQPSYEQNMERIAQQTAAQQAAQASAAVPPARGASLPPLGMPGMGPGMGMGPSAMGPGAGMGPGAAPSLPPLGNGAPKLPDLEPLPQNHAEEHAYDDDQPDFFDDDGLSSSPNDPVDGGEAMQADDPGYAPADQPYDNDYNDNYEDPNADPVAPMGRNRFGAMPPAAGLAGRRAPAPGRSAMPGRMPDTNAPQPSATSSAQHMSVPSAGAGRRPQAPVRGRITHTGRSAYDQYEADAAPLDNYDAPNAAPYDQYDNGAGYDNAAGYDNGAGYDDVQPDYNDQSDYMNDDAGYDDAQPDYVDDAQNADQGYDEEVGYDDGSFGGAPQNAADVVDSAEIDALRARLEEAENEARSLRHQLDDAESARAEAEAEIEALRSEVEMGGDNSELQAKLDEVQALLDAKIKENDSVYAQLQEAEDARDAALANASDASELDALHNQIQELQGQLSQAEASLSDAEDERAEALINLKQVEDDRNAWRSKAEQAAADLDAARAGSDSAQSDLQAALADLQSKLAQSEDARAALQNELNAVSDRANMLDQENADLAQANQDLGNQYADLQASYDELANQYNALQDDYDALAANDQSQAEIQNLNDALAQTKDLVSNIAAERDSAVAQANASSAELQSLRAANADLKNELQKAKAASSVSMPAVSASGDASADFVRTWAPKFDNVISYAQNAVNQIDALQGVDPAVSQGVHDMFDVLRLCDKKLKKVAKTLS